MPTSFFQHIVHITTLKLHSISLIDFYEESSLTRSALKGVAPIASHSVIDHCFWCFALSEYEISFIRLFFIRDKKKGQHDH